MKVLPLLALPAALILGASALGAPDDAQQNTQRNVHQSAAEPLPSATEPRQVILIIGDGMDEQQLTIARNYLKGARGRLLLDEMPIRGVSHILTVEDSTEGQPIYVADSANTATSLATGHVTSRGRIATSAGSDRDLTTITELAKAKGYRTGIISSASVTDATPAAFMAHISYRGCENPQQMPAVMYKDIDLGLNCKTDMRRSDGPGSISEQLAGSDVDVILGGGSKHFTDIAENETISVHALAQRNGFQVVDDLAGLQAAPTGQQLLGLFSASTLPVRLRGEGGRKAEQPEPSFLNYVHKYLGDVTLPETMKCEPNPEFAGIPTLKQMTDTALQHLSAGNDRGFFLMVESASIDKQSHKRQPCGSIGEVEQLNEVLASALKYAVENPRTLVLVTADHSQAAQLIPAESLFARFPIPTYTPGHLARITTPEGSILAVNYATTNFAQEEHTGAAVPLYSNSEGQGLVPAFVQQPEIFTIMKNYLGL